MAQTQLLFFSALAFTLLLLSGIYPSEIRAINLDFDLIYRKGSRLAVSVVTGITGGIAKGLDYVFIKTLPAKLAALSKHPLSSMMKEYKNISVTTGSMPETITLIPSGIPVLIAVAFLLILSAVFLF